MDDVPPVAHLSSDIEDEEPAKNPSTKSDGRQRGPPKKLSREARAACRHYAESGVPHKFLAARYNCSLNIISRVVNNSFRIPDNIESDKEHFEQSEDKDVPGDYELFFNKTKQPRRGKIVKLEKKQEIKFAHDQSAPDVVSSARATPGPASLSHSGVLETFPPTKDRPKSTSPMTLPQEIVKSISSYGQLPASSGSLWGIKRKREEIFTSPYGSFQATDEHRLFQAEKQPRTNGSHPNPITPITPTVPSMAPVSKFSPRDERAKETSLPPMNGRFDDLELSSNGSNITSRAHQSEGTPSSASVSRYTLVPATAEDFIVPVQGTTPSTSQSNQTDEQTDEPENDECEEDEPEEDESMDDDAPLLPAPHAQVQSTSQPQRLTQLQPQPQPEPQPRSLAQPLQQQKSRNSTLLKPALPPPSNPLSEIEAFLKALKPDLSSLLPIFKELGIKDGEYLDGLRSIPRKDNKEWFDELTAKGLFTPFQAHVILRALYN